MHGPNASPTRFKIGLVQMRMTADPAANLATAVGRGGRSRALGRPLLGKRLHARKVRGEGLPRRDSPPALVRSRFVAVDFSLTDEQRQIQELARDFARREIRPVAAEYDEREEMPWPVLEKAAKVGLLAYGFPDRYGGGGVPDGAVGITNFIVTEELGWGCAAIATEIGSSVYAAGPILAFGTEDQRERYLPRFCDPDEVRLGALCLTEPQAGSDIQAIETTARREGDVWVIDGRKQFITNGGIADVHVVFAKVEGEGGLGAFIVESGTPGLEMGRKERKLGMRASDTAELVRVEYDVLPAATTPEEAQRSLDRFCATTAEARVRPSTSDSNPPPTVILVELAMRTPIAFPASWVMGDPRFCSVSRPQEGARKLGVKLATAC